MSDDDLALDLCSGRARDLLRKEPRFQAIKRELKFARLNAEPVQPHSYSSEEAGTPGRGL